MLSAAMLAVPPFLLPWPAPGGQHARIVPGHGTPFKRCFGAAPSAPGGERAGQMQPAPVHSMPDVAFLQDVSSGLARLFPLSSFTRLNTRSSGRCIYGMFLTESRRLTNIENSDEGNLLTSEAWKKIEESANSGREVRNPVQGSDRDGETAAVVCG